MLVLLKILNHPTNNKIFFFNSLKIHKNYSFLFFNSFLIFKIFYRQDIKRNEEININNNNKKYYK